jgi:hypothetical protein
MSFLQEAVMSPVMMANRRRRFIFYSIYFSLAPLPRRGVGVRIISAFSGK